MLPSTDRGPSFKAMDPPGTTTGLQTCTYDRTMDTPASLRTSFARPSALVTDDAPRFLFSTTCRPARMTSNGHRYGTGHATCRGVTATVRNARAYDGRTRHETDTIKRTKLRDNFTASTVTILARELGPVREAANVATVGSRCKDSSIAERTDNNETYILQPRTPP